MGAGVFRPFSRCWGQRMRRIKKDVDLSDRGSGAVVRPVRRVAAAPEELEAVFDGPGLWPETAVGSKLALEVGAAFGRGVGRRPGTAAPVVITY